MFLLVVGSLIFLCAYLEQGRRRFLVASLVLYGLSLLTYEISMALFPLHFVILWLYPRRHSIRSAVLGTLSYAGMAVGAAAVAVGLRLYYGRALTRSAAEFATRVAGGVDMSKVAYAPNFDPGAILTTLARQVVAAVPLSYQSIGTSTQDWASSFLSDISHSPRGGAFLIAAYIVIAVLISLQIGREDARGVRLRWGLLLWLGAGLVVLPQVLISLSPRYQVEVYWGVGYLPVFFGYLGMAVLLAAVIYGLVALGGSRGRTVLVVGVLVLAAAFSYVGVVNFYNNQAAVELINRAYLYPRAILSDAMGRGLLGRMPADASLVLDAPLPWESKAYFEGGSGSIVGSITPVPALSSSLPSDTLATVAADGSTVYDLAPASKLYFVSCRGFWAANGYAVFGRIKRLVVRPGQPSMIVLERVRMYVAAAARPAGQTTVPKAPLDGLPKVSPAADGFSQTGLSQVSSGPHWRLLETAQNQTIEVSR